MLLSALHKIALQQNVILWIDCITAVAISKCVSELEDAVEKAVIINEDGILSEEHFHFPRKIAAPATETSVSTLEEMELQMIQKAIEKCNGNLSAVAAQLGITRQTLYNKMKKFGL